MTDIHVLIVDDSSTVRLMLREYLGSEPGIEIVGAARNGQEALDRLDRYKPDVVLLDVDMPVLNGLETLPKLRELRPDLPVLMFSRLTDRGASETIDALFLGAGDYVLKPDSSDALKQCITNELVPKLRALVGAEVDDSVTGTAPPPSEPLVARLPGVSVLRHTLTDAPPHRAAVLAIAASTGGPRALAELIPMLPADLPVPVVIVQHMPPGFTATLAERLDSMSPLTVREAGNDQPLSSADIWIAPGNQHMVIHRAADGVHVQCHDGPPENSCRPSADVLFRSVLKEFGTGTLAVVLTGMGDDGLSSCGEIVDRGGRILVQDEASSAAWGMPGRIARAGLAEAVLPIDELGRELQQSLSRRRPSS